MHIFTVSHAPKPAIFLLIFDLDLVKYDCSRRTCPWRHYIRGVDWGFYSEDHGDCDACQKNCTDDIQCGAVECGRGGKWSYCSWWRIGACPLLETDTVMRSGTLCRKNSIGNKTFIEIQEIYKKCRYKK